MADPARAKRLAKADFHDRRLGDRVRDQGSAAGRRHFTDAKVTGDLHDATLYYTVPRAFADRGTGTTPASRRPWRAPKVLRTKVGRHRGEIPRRWRSCARHRSRRRAPDGGVAGTRPAADADVARIRAGATPAATGPPRVVDEDAKDARDDDRADDD